MSDTIDDKDQAKINLEEADKKVRELVRTSLKKLPPLKAVEITQKLALHTAISALAHLPRNEIVRNLKQLHAENMLFVPHVLEVLGVGWATSTKEGADNE